MTPRAPSLIEFARSWLGLPLSDPQQVLLRAIGTLEMPAALLPLWVKHTGRETYEPREWAEVLALCGRRSGKDDVIATTTAVHEALFRAVRVSPGETPRVVIVAQNLKAAGIAFSYCRAKLRKCEEKLRAKIVQAETKDEITIRNAHGQDVVIGCYPPSIKSIRGATVMCAVADELAFWWDDDRFANPAEEVLSAIRPAMATVPGAKLILATTPWTKSGCVWEAWEKRAERPDVLVFHAATAEMNPSISAAYLAREKARDPDAFRREYEAEFVDSVSAFLTYAEVLAAVDVGVTRRPPAPGHRYVAALDPSQRKADAFALAIGHQEGDAAILDLVHGWGAATGRTLSNTALLEQLAAILKEYGVSQAVTDSYGFAFLRDDAVKLGLRLEERTTSAQSKAKVYLGLKSKVLSGQLRLVDHEAAIAELVGLECISTAGGLMRFEASRGRHDDYASAISLLVAEMPTHVMPRVTNVLKGWEPSREGRHMTPGYDSYLQSLARAATQGRGDGR